MHVTCLLFGNKVSRSKNRARNLKLIISFSLSVSSCVLSSKCVMLLHLIVSIFEMYEVYSFPFSCCIFFVRCNLMSFGGVCTEKRGEKAIV